MLKKNSLSLFGYLSFSSNLLSFVLLRTLYFLKIDLTKSIANECTETNANCYRKSYAENFKRLCTDGSLI